MFTATPTSCMSENDANDAIKHIFNVASGLDSLMLGDSQILGQAKTKR